MPEIPVVDAYYYDVTDVAKVVGRCLLVLPTGDAVVATNKSARIVPPEQLVLVQPPANDVFVRFRALLSGLTGPRATEAAALLAVLERWARRIPAPDAEGD